MSDKVLDIEVQTDWPDNRFYLDLVEKGRYDSELEAILGLVDEQSYKNMLELRNGAYRFVRVELYDADRPDSPPLHTGMDALGNDWRATGFDLDQTAGPRAGYISQGGFLEVYGASIKSVPLPDLGLVRQYRLEVVGINQSSIYEIESQDPVPTRYHRTITHVFEGFPLSSWQVLEGLTYVDQFIIPLLLGWQQRATATQGAAYLRGFGENWRSTKEPPGGPNAAIVLGLLIYRILSGNSSTSNLWTLVWDTARTFVELIASPEPSFAWIPSEYLNEKIRAQILRLRSRLLKNIAEKEFAKRIAKANVGVSIAGFLIDFGELAAFSNSLQNVNKVSNALIEARKDKTLLALDPEPRTLASGEQFGLRGARFSWYRLPETGAAQTRPELTSLNLASAAFSAMVQIEPSDLEAVFVSDIVMADGAAAPLRLFIRPAALSGDLTYPGVDRDGPPELHRRVEFQNGLEPLLTAHNPGSGVLEIEIENLDHLESLGSMTASKTLRETPIMVEKRPPDVLPPAGFGLQVGEETNLPFLVKLAGGETFRADAPFEARLVEARDEGREMAFYGLRFARTHPWTGEESRVEAPFTLVIRLKNDDGLGAIDASDHARMRAPQSIGYVDGFERYDLGAYLLGRSVGYTLFEAFLEDLESDSDYADFTDANRPNLRIPVAPTKVELDLIPVDDPLGQNRLVIEGEELGDPLIGRIFLQARALDALLFDSDQSLFIAGVQAPDEITLNEIYTEDAEGAFQRVPFRLRLHVTDTEVARLEIPDFPSNFSGTAQIGGWLRAVGPGETTLYAELLELPEDEQDEHAAYTLPHTLHLTVEVPAPLEIELDSWTDALGVSAIAGGAPDREAIHDSGALSGRIRHHRPSSEVEVVTLTLVGQTIDLLPLLDEQGRFSADLEISLGANQIEVFATKPINELLNGPAESPVTVIGAQPRAIDLSPDVPFDFDTEQFFLKEHRTIGFSVRYGRATTAAVQYMIGGAPNDPITEGLPQSYDDDTVSGLWFVPDLPATHSLDLKAENAFTSSHRSVAIQTAPRIVPDAIELIPLGFFKQGDPTRVGFDTTEIKIHVLAECAKKAYFRNVTTGGQSIVKSFGPGFSNFAVATVSLQVGANEIEIRAENEFGNVPHPPLVVYRRADIWSRHDLAISIDAFTDTSSDYFDAELFEGYSKVDETQNVDYTLFLIPDAESPTLQQLINYKIRFEQKTGRFPIIVSVSGTFIGPNYQEAVPCFARPDQAVEDSVENNTVGNPFSVLGTAPQGWKTNDWEQLSFYDDLSYYSTFVDIEDSYTTSAKLHAFPSQGPAS